MHDRIWLLYRDGYLVTMNSELGEGTRAKNYAAADRNRLKILKKY
ncbi:hypothetical protein [Paenibacillus sp. FSL R10-2734]